MVNEVSWKVYRRELCKDMPYKRYMWEVTKFYLMKFWILLSYMDIRVRSMFGFKVNVEEL